MMQELQQLPLFGSPLSPTEGGALNAINASIRGYCLKLPQENGHFIEIISASKETHFDIHLILNPTASRSNLPVHSLPSERLNRKRKISTCSFSDPATSRVDQRQPTRETSLRSRYFGHSRQKTRFKIHRLTKHSCASSRTNVCQIRMLMCKAASSPPHRCPPGERQHTSSVH
jgi:hypothetical protein